MAPPEPIRVTLEIAGGVHTSVFPPTLGLLSAAHCRVNVTFFPFLFFAPVAPVAPVAPAAPVAPVAPSVLFSVLFSPHPGSSRVLARLVRW
jgi:hypothetical protein